MPFAAWRASPKIMPEPHRHTDVEMNLVLSGGVRYLLAGRFVEVPTERLFIFWAGIPHRLTRVAPETEFLILTLPLGWLLSWKLCPTLVERLLRGEALLGGEEDGPLDTLSFLRWTQELPRRGADGETVRIALLELEARFRRLARELPSAPGVRRDDATAVERLTAYLSAHYQRPLIIREIAREVGLHPNYAMTAFKEGTGMTIWEYLTRLRLAHAQRLLLTTDNTVDFLARESGFGSSSRFFAAFQHVLGCTPGQYRRDRR